MTLYEEDGTTLDLDLAADLVAQSERLSNDAQRKANLALVSAGALLDIAASLRVLAAEAGAYLTPDTATASTAGEGEHAEPVDLTRADAGTRVRHLHTGELGTLMGTSGVDQGEPWVAVDFDELGGPGRFWVTVLEALPITLDTVRESPVPLAGVASGGEAQLLRNDEDEDGETATGGYELDPDDEPEPPSFEPPAVADVDDLDADFDGDRHAEATDALAALRARNKAAKKGKKS